LKKSLGVAQKLRGTTCDWFVFLVSISVWQSKFKHTPHTFPMAPVRAKVTRVRGEGDGTSAASPGRSADAHGKRKAADKEKDSSRKRQTTDKGAESGRRGAKGGKERALDDDEAADDRALDDAGAATALEDAGACMQGVAEYSAGRIDGSDAHRSSAADQVLTQAAVAGGSEPRVFTQHVVELDDDDFGGGSSASSFWKAKSQPAGAAARDGDAQGLARLAAQQQRKANKLQRKQLAAAAAQEEQGRRRLLIKEPSDFAKYVVWAEGKYSRKKGKWRVKTHNGRHDADAGVSPEQHHARAMHALLFWTGYLQHDQPARAQAHGRQECTAMHSLAIAMAANMMGEDHIHRRLLSEGDKRSQWWLVIVAAACDLNLFGPEVTCSVNMKFLAR